MLQYGKWPRAVWLSWLMRSAGAFPVPLQASYSNDALFIDIGLFCADSFLNTLYAFPKRVLYTPPADNQADINVWRATYLPSSSWYHSLPSKDQLLVYDPTDPSFTNPFNTFLLPARPQIRKDVSDPMFVMGKVCK